ncbi:hypothetical protein PBI_CANTARE_86 [Brevibacterium phage Cantare]|uniref:Helix-turn-helix domain-containing protein n=1 Tax=Brevibacterium phage Cantare TaxID=2338395 RepID=A0A3G3LYW9_9CAUD|nr:hypothetical protein PQD70_gp086 [Brevibacterium phage Cantare]AYQ99306.1 hypothetical protein PBI_CANTARE_86 [Brevibacterium phage Cantare]
MNTKMTNEQIEQIRKVNTDPTVAELLNHIDVLTKELDSKYELVSLSDIARMDGVSRQNVYNWSITKRFPSPIVTVGKQRLWAKKDIDKWMKERFN